MLTGDTKYATASFGLNVLEEVRRILDEDLAKIRRKNRNLRWTVLSLALAFLGWLIGVMIKAHT